MDGKVDAARVRQMSLAVASWVAFSFLSGCSLTGSSSEMYAVDNAVLPQRNVPGTEGKESPTKFPLTSKDSPDPIDLARFRLPGYGPKSLPALAMISTTPDAQEARALRDQLIVSLLSHSDKICKIHKANIIGNAGAANFGTGLAAAILSSISAIIGQQTAKTALSAAATVVTGGRAMINQHFYANFLAPAILREIDKLREDELGRIELRMKTDSIHDYPVESVVRDLTRYHNRCSFYKGLVALTDDKDKFINVLSREQIDQEICILEKENEELVSIFAPNSRASNEQKSTASMSFQYNSIRLDQLRLQRTNTFGGTNKSCEQRTADSNTPQ